MDIASIGVHADHLMPLGLDKNGAIETPPLSQPQTLGYYTRSSPPCVPGPSKVPFGLIGHVDSGGKPGVLYRLKSMKPGDTVTVGLDNGTHCTYRIGALDQFEKQDFPTERVWGPTPSAAINVVTCGGPFIGRPYFYRDNIVASGSLVS